MATTKIGPGIALTSRELHDLTEEARNLPEAWTVEAVSVRSTGAFSLSVNVYSPRFTGVVTESFEFGRIEDACGFLKRQKEKYPQA